MPKTKRKPNAPPDRVQPVVKPSSPMSRMDNACYSPDPLTQFLKRKSYHETYLADLLGSERLDRRISEEGFA